MGLTRLTERSIAPFTGCQVNRDAGTIGGVLICGTTSANGRDYPAAVLRRDHAVYEGRPVNCDHAQQQTTVDRRLGWFTGVRPGDDGRPRGTLHLLKSHPMYERVIEAAERNPALYGFSHVAMCTTKRGADGREVVESINSVESIDLVADPATTGGLFESKGNPVPFAVSKLAEWVTKHPKSTTTQIFKAKKLAEMDGADGAMMADEPAADSDPNEAITAGFKAAIDAIVGKCLSGEMPWKEGRKKIDKLFGSHMDATGGDTKDAADEPADEDTEPAAEGKNKRKPTAASDPVTVLSECEKAGYRPSAAELRVLVLMSTSDRAEYVTEHRRKLAEATATNPTGASRRPGAGGVPAKVEESKAPPIDGKAFGKFISE